MISSIFALKALKESRSDMGFNFGLALVADEEIGSRFGMQKLMDEGIFAKHDMFIVPDYGSPDGSKIEIGEKGMLWLKFTIKGAQAHASTPDLGKNAFRYAARLVNQLDVFLHSKYSSENVIFQPGRSTFEMTKHEKNVDSVNIIPGTEVFYMDLRVLPQYKLDDVLFDIREIAKSPEYKDVDIDMDVYLREESAPITDPNSEVVKLLESSIKDLRGIDTIKIGIGGGTCAAFPRRRGMQAAVWATNDDMAHTPNEYCRIRNLVDDAKVFAYMLTKKD